MNKILIIIIFITTFGCIMEPKVDPIDPNLEFQSNFIRDTIVFYTNCIMRSGTLINDTEISNNIFASNSTVNFYSNGIVMNGILK